MQSLFKSLRTTPRPRKLLEAEVPQLKNAQLAAIYHGRHSGGDFHDFFRASHNRVLFALFDIAGKHRQNRNIVLAAQNKFRSLGMQLFLRDDVNEVNAMIEICLQVNLAILEAADTVCSSPAFAGCYNESLGTLCFFNAGHTPGLLKHSTGITELQATGLPLGLFSHITPDASMVAVEPGAVVLVVSRGAVEARNRSQEFGLFRVEEYLSHTETDDAKEICAAVLHELQHFTHKRSMENDVTILSLSRPPAKAAAAR